MRGSKQPKPPAPPADPLATVLPSALQATHAWALVLVGGLAGLAFLNSLGNGLVADDRLMIVQNSLIRPPANLRAIFTSPYWPKEYIDGMYRPLLVLTYALNYAVGGLHPFGYHLVNVLLHAANSALVYGLTWQLFRQRGLALLTAAAFALHPIHTEAVANVVGRGELLAAAFAFLAWLLYLHRDSVPRVPRPPSTSPSPPEGEKGWDEGESAVHRHPRTRAVLLAGSVGSFALALLSKEHAIVLPGLLLLSDALRATQRTSTVSVAAMGRILGRRLVTIYPAYLLVAGAFLLVRAAVVGALTMGRINWVLNPIAYVDTPTRLLTALKVLGRELGLLLAPLTLSADYSYNQIPLATSPLEPAVWLPLLIAGALAWLLRRPAPAVPFGLLVFLVAIAPVANLFFPIGSIMAERQLYLPSLGGCLAVAALVVLALARLAARPALRWLPVGAFGLLLIFYAGRTVTRNQAWATDLGLWWAAVAASPHSAKAYFSLAWALKETGDLEGARHAVERALRIHAAWYEPQQLLGVILSMQGRWDEAIAAHQVSIRLDPQAPEPYYNLARAYEQKGMLPEARGTFERAAAGDLPREKALLYLGIGDLLARHGELPEAERWLEKATQSYPRDVYAHLYLGNVYWKRGRLAEARASFERAVRLDPNSAKGHHGLGLVLRAEGREAEAQRQLSLAVEQRRRESAQREANRDAPALPGLDPR